MVFIQESKIAPKLQQYPTISQIKLNHVQVLIHVGGASPFPNKALHDYGGSAGFLGNIYPACQAWM